MIRLLLAVLCGLPLLRLQAQADASYAPLRVMSFNLRLNVEGDGYNAWPHRTGLVESMIRFHQVDLLGVQEARPGQMEDLQRMLPDFAFEGVARDTGSWGEYSAIWYRRSRLERLEGGTFWLSETPDQPGSRGWDAALPRIATWARLCDRRSDKSFLFVNTHFDHRGEQARAESAHLLLEKIESLAGPLEAVLLSGDFNATPESEPIQILTDVDNPQRVYDLSPSALQSAHGPASTWSGFAFPGEPGRRIDYLFGRGNLTCLRYGTLSESWSGRFPSDHLPVLAEVLIDPLTPLPAAHAHNDYTHERPLFDALDQGFTSVEADVWLIDGTLYVYHDKPRRPDPGQTLEQLYLAPLAARVTAQQGWVYPGYRPPFFLMIDLKSEAEPTYAALHKLLARYEWLLDGSQPGGVRIFLSGNRPMEAGQADGGQLAGLDGRPEDLGKGIAAQLMPVVSERYGKLCSWRGQGLPPEADTEALRELVQAAHAEGKKVRLWATPESEAVWAWLQTQGVDLINTDELTRLRAWLIRGPEGE
ncbi:MAG: hypothetical protein D6722_11450 [Bacteroidetes bacterium]|nr:MAG: hypothetical protein D6722_11450 [Bacteroidota bacterium]